MTRKKSQRRSLALLLTLASASGSDALGVEAPPATYPLASVSFELSGGGAQSGWSIRVEGSGKGVRESYNPYLVAPERSQFTVDPSRVFELLQRCYREGVFDLHTTYGPPNQIRLRPDGAVDTLGTAAEDAAWTSLRIRIDRYEKVISWLKGLGNPPPIIEELERRIEALVAQAPIEDRPGGSSNQRLDAPHSGVTALAQGRKHRATGRAGYRYRSADLMSTTTLPETRTALEVCESNHAYLVDLEAVNDLVGEAWNQHPASTWLSERRPPFWYLSDSVHGSNDGIVEISAEAGGLGGVESTNHRPRVSFSIRRFTTSQGSNSISPASMAAMRRRISASQAASASRSAGPSKLARTSAASSARSSSPKRRASASTALAAFVMRRTVRPAAPPNNPINPTAVPVTRLALTRLAPVTSAGYRAR